MPASVSPKKRSSRPCGKGARAGLGAASLRRARAASECLVAITSPPGEPPIDAPLSAIVYDDSLPSGNEPSPMTRDRILVIVLALWGLAMIVPDLVRVVHPLGSFGLYANNDGLIYSVSGPFEDRASSPAWQAGIRVGDRLDLERLRCRLSDVSKLRPGARGAWRHEFRHCPAKTVTLPLAATEHGARTPSDPGRHSSARPISSSAPSISSARSRA